MATIDDKVKDVSDKESLQEKIEKPRLWDFLFAAYSSSRSIRLLLSSLALGYGYALSIAAASTFYITVRTIAKSIKYAALSLYYGTKEYGFLNYMSNTLNDYLPWGRLWRPTLMGATLSTALYFGL